MAQTNPTGRLPLNQLNCYISLKSKSSRFSSYWFHPTALPQCGSHQYFEHYPFRKMVLPFDPVNDWNDMPASCDFSSNSANYGINRFPDNQKKNVGWILATVTFIDEQLGRILDTLEELKLDKTTTVIFTSDHGYLLGASTIFGKGNLREEVTRVPLIIRAPTYQHGRVHPLSNIDLFQTVHVNLQVYQFLISFRAKALCPHWMILKEQLKIQPCHSFPEEHP